MHSYTIQQFVYTSSARIVIVSCEFFVVLVFHLSLNNQIHFFGMSIFIWKSKWYRYTYIYTTNEPFKFVLQVPLYVATKMASIKRSSFFVPSASGYAKAGLRWLGHEPRCTPYWPHSVIWALLYSLPECAVDY